MNYGYVCVSFSKNTWLARAIAWLTQSQWSHSFLTVSPMLGREMVLESGQHGVGMVPFDLAYRNNDTQQYEVYQFNVDQEIIDGAILKTVDLLETSYGFAEYPWFLWRAINKFFGRDIKKQNNWLQDGTVCSDLVRLYITNAGYGYLFDEFGVDAANAQDIYNIILSNPKLFTFVEKKN